MQVIGLTGPSGAGKGIVGALFASYGIPVLDTDAIYHELLIPPSACLEELVNAFGETIRNQDGTLNRTELGKIVFSDHDALHRLDEISHRHIMAEVRRRISALQNIGTPAVILDAPQLFEAHAEQECNIIVAVLADPEIRLARIMARDGISEEAARRRMKSQLPDAFFREHANIIIENQADPEALRPEVLAVMRKAGVTTE